MLSNTLAALLKLPANDRIELALALWESLTDAEREAEFELTSEQEAAIRGLPPRRACAPSLPTSASVTRRSGRSCGRSSGNGRDGLTRGVIITQRVDSVGDREA